MVQLHLSGLHSNPRMIALRMQTARPLGLAVLLCASLFATGCAQRSMFEEPIEFIFRLANQSGWSATRYRGGDFSILTFSPAVTGNEKTLNIYIEGDGYSWADRYTLARDPSPHNPVSLLLAFKEPGDAVYLARPCQYLSPDELANCSPVFWSSARYAPEVLASLGEVIDKVKKQRKSTNIRLHGYSGGGVVAALLAARRADVVELITYAAPLDIKAWTALHGLSPLRYSLNPADEMDVLRSIPQIHYVGGKDTEVPPILMHDFVKRLKAGEKAKVVVVGDADHSCCW